MFYLYLHIYNQILTGEPGYQLLQIDAAGFHNKELQVTSPIAGGDLYLTIDYNIQKMCNEILSLKQPGKHKNQIKGAIVNITT